MLEPEKAQLLMYNFMPETRGSYQTKVVRSRLLLLMIRVSPSRTNKKTVQFSEYTARLPGIVKRQLGHSFQNISAQSCSLVVVFYVASSQPQGCLRAGRKDHWTGHLV